jgi:hypothetical protein
VLQDGLYQNIDAAIVHVMGKPDNKQFINVMGKIKVPRKKIKGLFSRTVSPIW